MENQLEKNRSLATVLNNLIEQSEHHCTIIVIGNYNYTNFRNKEYTDFGNKECRVISFWGDPQERK